MRPQADVALSGASLVKVNLAASIAMVGALIGATATATVGYQNIMARLDRYDAAIYGAASDRSAPGLKADMKSADERLNILTETIAILDNRVSALESPGPRRKPIRATPQRTERDPYAVWIMMPAAIAQGHP
jgi:hypothetical protein